MGNGRAIAEKARRGEQHRAGTHGGKGHAIIVEIRQQARHHAAFGLDACALRRAVNPPAAGNDQNVRPIFAPR